MWKFLKLYALCVFVILAQSQVKGLPPSFAWLDKYLNPFLNDIFDPLKQQENNSKSFFDIFLYTQFITIRTVCINIEKYV